MSAASDVLRSLSSQFPGAPLWEVPGKTVRAVGMTYIERGLVEIVTDSDRNRHPMTRAGPYPSAECAAHDEVAAPEDVLIG